MPSVNPIRPGPPLPDGVTLSQTEANRAKTTSAAKLTQELIAQGKLAKHVGEGESLQASRFKESDGEKTVSQKKSRSVFQRFKDNTYDYGAKGLMMGAKAFFAGVGIITDPILFFYTDPDKQTEESLEELSSLSGGSEFGQMLSMLGPVLVSDVLVPQAGDLGGTTLDWMSSLPGAFQPILPTAMLNAAKAMKKDEEYAKVPVTPVNVITFLFKTIRKELNRVSSELAQADSITDPKKREKARTKAISPVAGKIMKLMFPNGAYDLPLAPGIRWAVWSYLKNNIVPNQLLKLEGTKKFHELRQGKGTEFLRDAAHNAAVHVIDDTKKYLREKSPDAALKMINQLPQFKQMEDGDQNNLTTYLSAQLKELGETVNPGVDEMWGFLGSGAEDAIVHIFSNLSKDKKPSEEASAVVATKLFQILSDFVKANKEKIDNIYKRLEQREIPPKDIVKHPDYIEAFSPLARAYQESLGFGKDQDVPELIKGLFDALIINQGPKYAAEHAQDLVFPLSELFDAVNNPKPPSQKFPDAPDSANLFQICNALGDLVAQNSPELIKGQSRNIAEKIENSLPAGTAIKSWLGKWVEGQFVELITSKNQTIDNLWKFIASAVPDLMVHILLSLSMGKKDSGNILLTSVNTLLGRFRQFAKDQDNAKRIKEHYDKLKANNQNPAKDKEFIALFEPFCKGLMKDVGIGYGKKLPVPELLNTTAEELIKNAGPEQCAQLYCDFSSFFVPEKETDEGVAQFSSVMTKVLAKRTPELLTQNSEMLAQNIVDKLFPDDQPTTEKQKKADLKQWIAAQIKVLGPEISTSYPEIWLLLQASVESVISHAVASISKDKVTQTEVSFYGVFKLLQTLNQFIQKEDPNIAKKFNELRQQGIPERDIVSHPEYINLFIPLAENIQKLMGLADFPGVVKSSFESVFIKEAPQHLAKNHNQFLLPLTALFQAIQDPKAISQKGQLLKFPGGQRLTSWCDIAGKAIGEDLPKYFSDSEQSKEVASDIALKLVKSVANEEQNKILNDPTKKPPENIPPELQEVYQWACNWFSLQIKAAANSDDPYVQSFWEFSKYAVDALTAHIMLHLVGDGNGDQDVLFVALNKLITSFKVFHEKRGAAILEAYNKLPKDINPQVNKDFVQLFQPLFDDITAKVGIQKGTKLPLPDLLTGIAQEQLQKLGPEYLAAFYCNFTAPEEYRKNILMKIDKVANPNGEVEQTVRGGTAKAIENMCSICSKELIRYLCEGAIIKKGKNEPALSLNQELPILKDPQTAPFLNQLQEAISSILLEIIGNRLEKSSQGDLSITGRGVINDTLSKLVTSMFVFSPQEQTEIEAAFALESQTQKNKTLRKLFAGRASEVFDLLKSPSSPEGGLIKLPLPPEISEKLWKYLATNAIPDFLIQVYADRLLGNVTAKDEQSEMMKITGSDMRSEVCGVLADFVSQFVPAFTRRDHENIAEDLYDLAAKQLGKTNPDPLTVADYIKRHEGAIKKELGGVMMDVSDSVKGIRPIAKETIRLSLVKAFTGLTKRIESFESPTGEKYQKDFMVKTGLQMMSITKDHLHSLNTIAKAHKKDSFYEVDRDILIKEFDSLPPGIAKTPELLEAHHQVKQSLGKLRTLRQSVSTLKKYGFFTSRSVKRLEDQIKAEKKKLRKAKSIEDNHRKKFFFEPFAKQVLSLSGLKNPSDLPVPSPLNIVVWDQLQSNILPNVLLGIFDTILESQSLNQIIITALDNFNAPPTPLPKGQEPPKIPQDKLQDEVDKVSGELFQQIVEMLPPSFLKNTAIGVVRLEKLKSAVGKTIGQSLRKTLGEKLPLQKIIEQSLPSLVENLHGGILKIEVAPGKWEKLTSQPTLGQNIKFFPTRTTPDGESVESEEPDFGIPKDYDAAEAAAIRQIQQEEESQEKVRVNMIGTAHKTVADKISEDFSQSTIVLFLKDIINAISDIWDKLLSKCSPKVRWVLDMIFCKIILNLIKLVALVAGSPFILIGVVSKKLFWYVMDRFIAREVDHILKSVHTDIHENLLYKLSQKLLDSIEGDLPKQQTDDLRKKLALAHENLLKKAEEGILKHTLHPFSAAH